MHCLIPLDPVGSNCNSRVLSVSFDKLTKLSFSYCHKKKVSIIHFSMFLFIFFLEPIDIASTNAFDKALEAPRRTRCWDRGIVPAPKIVINLPMTYEKFSGLAVRDIFWDK